MGQRVEEKVRLDLCAQQAQLGLRQTALQGLLPVLPVSRMVLGANAREHRITKGLGLASAAPAIDPEDAIEPGVHRLAGDEKLASRRAIG